MNRALKGILIFLIIIALLPLLITGLSFIGRISSDSVLKEGYIAYLRIPNPVTALDRLIRHEALEEILSEPEFAMAAPAVRGIAESGLLHNPLLRFAGNGDLDGALYDDGAYIFSWDAGIISPLLKLIPSVVSRLNIPGLYYVQAGKLSRFEYRADDTTTIYLGVLHNLAVITDSRETIESILGSSKDERKTSAIAAQKFSASGFDAGIKVRGTTLLSMFLYQDPKINELLSNVVLGEFAEAAVSIEDSRIRISMESRVRTRIAQLDTLLARNSHVPGILDILPSTTQYATIMSMASVKELVDLAQAVQGPELTAMLKKADTASRLLLRVSVDDLLYSWTGEETAVFGLEGRPKPVFAIRIANENRRKQVFDSLLSSFAISGDSSVVLDGVRIPRIRMPEFLSAILSVWDIRIPAPYYLVENGFLLLSESPENLLETATARRRNSKLIQTEVWTQLTADTSDESGMSLFYSLDRSIPFFLKGNDTLARVLKLYGKGLAKLSVHNDTVRLSLTARTSHSAGPKALAGFPIKANGKIGPKVGLLSYKKDGSRRILYTLNGNTLAGLNPVDSSVLQYETADRLFFLPVSDDPLESAESPAVWTLSERGVAALLNGDLQPLQGFPAATGIPVSAEPVVNDGNLYITGTDGTFWRLSAEGEKVQISLPFSQVLRSPPAFAALGRKTVMAMYPKSFAGKLWLTDTDGDALDGWPVQVAGIAFGSPVLFEHKRGFYAAFLTQAGEFELFNEDGKPIPGFPMQLPGVFFLQPVWDGTYVWALASDGTVFRIGLDGVYDSRNIGGLSAKQGVLTAVDISKSKRLFISGEGNLLYGFTGDFAALPGFPVKGWGAPWIGDFDGDGYTECISPGLDNSIYGWRFK